MKSDRKFFVENLTCFVSRARNSGGVDTIRSFSVSKQLPPLVPTPPNTGRSNGQQLQQSVQPIHTSGSNVSTLSSVSSGSFDVNGSSDDFLTQDSDLFSVAPTTGESLDPLDSAAGAPTYRAGIRSHGDNNSAAMEPATGYNVVNRKPALRKWLAEDSDAPTGSEPQYDSGHPEPPRPAHKILGPAPVVDQREQVRRSTVPMPYVEKSIHVPPLPPAPVKLQPPSGRANGAPVIPLPAAPPLSRMPSPPHSKVLQSLSKTVWVWTRSKEVMRSAVEVGWTTFIFTPDTKFMAPQWTCT